MPISSSKPPLFDKGGREGGKKGAGTGGRGRETNNNNDNNSTNNDFFASISSKIKLVAWRDKTKGLSNPVIVKLCASRRQMDEGANKVSRIGSTKEIDVLDVGGMKLNILLI